MKIKFLFIFLISLISLCVIFGCSLYIINETIVVEKKEYFNSNDTINESINMENTLIFYWAEWCGVCKRIKPVWENTKKDINKKYSNLKIEEIECDDPNKCFMFNNGKRQLIDGVPTIILRSGNKDIEYKSEPKQNITCDKTSKDVFKFLDLYLEK
tara:strand:- start:440 stop:907 length:468 start_codon:yes stop_codon:yes gene_type:complete